MPKGSTGLGSHGFRQQITLSAGWRLVDRGAETVGELSDPVGAESRLSPSPRRRSNQNRSNHGGIVGAQQDVPGG